MRILIAQAVLLTLMASTALADVTIQLLDPETKMLRISYTITEVEAGVSDITFPPTGFDFAAGAITDVSAYDVKTREILKAEPVIVEGKKVPTAVHVTYNHPLEVGEQMEFKFTFTVPSASFYVDSKGQWTLDYTTSHALRFITPKGHQLVGVSVPVRIEEQGGQTVAVSDPDWADRRAIDFEFKTRPLK